MGLTTREAIKRREELQAKCPHPSIKQCQEGKMYYFVTLDGTEDELVFEHDEFESDGRQAHYCPECGYEFPSDADALNHLKHIRRKAEGMR